MRLSTSSVLVASLLILLAFPGESAKHRKRRQCGEMDMTSPLTRHCFPADGRSHGVCCTDIRLPGSQRFFNKLEDLIFRASRGRATHSWCVCTEAICDALQGKIAWRIDAAPLPAPVPPAAATPDADAPFAAPAAKPDAGAPFGEHAASADAEARSKPDADFVVLADADNPDFETPFEQDATPDTDALFSAKPGAGAPFGEKSKGGGIFGEKPAAAVAGEVGGEGSLGGGAAEGGKGGKGGKGGLAEMIKGLASKNSFEGMKVHVGEVSDDSDEEADDSDQEMPAA
ncbi:hypothetical protein T484DRAFT_1910153, partial [Baffinella frigidus]